LPIFANYIGIRSLSEVLQEQEMVQARGNPQSQTGLRLLSLGMRSFNILKVYCLYKGDLDGGGVRGLPTFLILKELMAMVNENQREEGQAVIKPCELFDLIGGTSTGE
jgi:hypothetical protein